MIGRKNNTQSSANVEDLAQANISTLSDGGDRAFITRKQYEALPEGIKVRAAMRIKDRDEFFEIEGHSHLRLGMMRGLMSLRKPGRRDWETGWSMKVTDMPQ